MIKINKFIDKYYDTLFTIIVLFGTFLYLLLMRGTDIWADEAYSFGIIKHTFGELWNITAADVHPPLYYILLKLFTQPFNYSLIAAKIFSIIPYIVILLIGGMQFKKYFDKKTSLLFMGLFLLFPFSLPYAIEIRMYSLAAMFVFLNAIFAYRCYKENNNYDWILFALFGICAAYTHYFAMVSVAVTYGILLLVSIKQQKLTKWLIASLGTVLFYIPWLAEFISQLAYKISNEYWIDEITLSTILKYISTIFGTNVNGFNLFFVFSALSYLIAFISVIISKQKKLIIPSVCALLIPIGTILIGVFASWLIRPIFIIRYIVPAIPLLISFMAISLGNMKNNYIVTSILTIALIMGVNNYGITFLNECKNTETTLENFLLNPHIYYDSYIVLTDSNHIPWILAYYNETKPIYDLRKITAANPFNNLKFIDDFSSENQDSVLLFIDTNKKIPKEYDNIYESTLLNQIDNMDIYLLTKQNIYS